MSVRRIQSEPLLRTYPLLSTETACDAIVELPDPPDQAARDGLLELVYRDGPARARVAALDRLASAPDGIHRDLLEFCLRDEAVTLRLSALEGTSQWATAGWFRHALGDTLRGDPNSLVRCRALELLGGLSGEDLRSLLPAADDPNWRVRQTLIELWRPVRKPEQRAEILRQLSQDAWPIGVRDRVLGVAGYLQFLWSEGALPGYIECRFGNSLPIRSRLAPFAP